MITPFETVVNNNKYEDNDKIYCVRNRVLHIGPRQRVGRFIGDSLRPALCIDSDAKEIVNCQPATGDSVQGDV